MKCRNCGSDRCIKFIDLGSAPASNSYLASANEKELYLPLQTFVCKQCLLVQTLDTVDRTHFFNKNYAYFSSTSTSWVDHAKKFSEMVINKLNLGCSSHVLEVASNDGYLLQNFLNNGVPCKGCEPSESVAKVAINKGINVDIDFFGLEYAKNNIEKFDLIIANNVFAHVPNINDFVAGLHLGLKKEGSISLEFPHILNLIKFNQFDTIYHEHYSYLSLITVERILNKHELRVYQVENLPTHGGSLRVFACKKSASIKIDNSVRRQLDYEKEYGLDSLEGYSKAQKKAVHTKIDFLSFLCAEKLSGKNTAAFGAAAKGSTLLNFAGVNSDLISFVFDSSPAKQNKFMPGSRIPIVAPSRLKEEKVDNLIIFPWNIAEEIKENIDKIVEKKVRIFTVIPQLREWK